MPHRWCFSCGELLNYSIDAEPVSITRPALPQLGLVKPRVREFCCESCKQEYLHTLDAVVETHRQLVASARPMQTILMGKTRHG